MLHDSYCFLSWLINRVTIRMISANLTTYGFEQISDCVIISISFFHVKEVQRGQMQLSLLFLILYVEWQIILYILERWFGKYMGLLNKLLTVYANPPLILDPKTGAAFWGLVRDRSQRRMVLPEEMLLRWQGIVFLVKEM